LPGVGVVSLNDAAAIAVARRFKSRVIDTAKSLDTRVKTSYVSDRECIDDQ